MRTIVWFRGRHWRSAPRAVATVAVATTVTAATLLVLDLLAAPPRQEVRARGRGSA